MSVAETEKTVLKISVLSIILNAFLAVTKFTGGFLGNSYAVISDAANSASDVLYSLIVIIGVKISLKKADVNHPFGHERFECVTAILLSFVLLLTGGGVGYTGIKNIASGAYKTFEAPTMFALAVSIVSVITKAIMFAYTFRGAKKVNSSALKADAFNHLSDVLSSLGCIIGVVGAMCGVLILDSIVCIIISLLIIRAAVQVFVEAIKKMTDEACDEQTETALKNFILSNEGVLRVDALLTRQFGNRVFVIAEIACDGDLTLRDAHSIAERVHSGMEKNFPEVKHVTVHVNPYRKTDESVNHSTIENIDVETSESKQ